MQAAPDEPLLALLKSFGPPARDGATLAKGIALLRPRAKTLVDPAPGLAVYGAAPAALPPVTSRPAARLDAVTPSRHDAMEEAARALAAETGLPLGQIAQPARLALTGSLASPPLFEMIEVLG